MNLARIALYEKQPERARQIYDEVLRLDAKNEDALLGEADISRSEGDAGNAVFWLEKARNANPRSTTPRIRLIDSYLARRDSAKAAAIGRELVGFAADDAAALRSAGRAFLADKDGPSAVATLQELVRLEPGSAPYHSELARAYSFANDTSNARVELEKSLELDPAALDVQKTYVQFMAGAKNLESASIFARKLTQTRPTEAAPNLLLGDLLLARRRRQEAVTAYEQGLAKRDNRLLVERIAAVQAGDREPAKAIETYDKWLKKHPDDATTRSLLASLLLEQGQNERALAEHERLARDEPENPIVLNNLAWLYDKSGDPRSLALAEKAHRIAPDAATISDTLGWLLVRKGDSQRALPILEMAASQAPATADFQYHYAVALSEVGKTDTAKQVLERLVGSGQTSPTISDARRLLDQLKTGK